MAATAPTGEIWLGTIAKYFFVGVMNMCAKFGAFTTKCTIHLAAGLFRSRKETCEELRQNVFGASSGCE